MTKQLFIVTDLGGGDGGKGGVVHKLCQATGAHTVIKVGGAQGSHGVHTAAGESFAFSQLGCGTFDGAKTHLSELMVIEPLALLHEAELLRYQFGQRDIFERLTVDRAALCVTPFHRLTSRLRELARKDKPKGTVGVGVGEAVNDAERFPELAIRAGDINRPGLNDKLEALRRQKLVDLESIIAELDQLWVADQELGRELSAALENPAWVEATANEWQRLGRQLKLVSGDYLAGTILSKPGTVVVESSHGVLTDRYYGFHPHTTRLRTLPEFSLDLIKRANYDGEIIKVGVSRAYQIRHGAGPMVTADPDLREQLLPGSSKEDNRWQGQVRVGALDLVALRYAIQVCGGPPFFDALALTWFDQLERFGRWPICQRYRGALDPEFFSPDGEILVRRGEDEAQLAHQARLGQALEHCRPEVSQQTLPRSKDRAGLAEWCCQLVQDWLGIPVRLLSFGPTEDDKWCF